MENLDLEVSLINHLKSIEGASRRIWLILKSKQEPRLTLTWNLPQLDPFLVIVSTSASILNSAVINGKVNLPCDISPANSDDSVALILWYKDDSLAPIYTIDARKGK